MCLILFYIFAAQASNILQTDQSINSTEERSSVPEEKKFPAILRQNALDGSLEEDNITSSRRPKDGEISNGTDDFEATDDTPEVPQTRSIEHCHSLNESLSNHFEEDTTEAPITGDKFETRNRKKVSETPEFTYISEDSDVSYDSYDSYDSEGSDVLELFGYIIRIPYFIFLYGTYLYDLIKRKIVSLYLNIIH
ncbi:hypothetical protein NGRA_3365 [Nosema granulosis]|uniref:Uncharacterized protein n=1 Tax=Nosema granulosis TaxID=83296 RepID=A0A9P6GWD1_9MICR|nr:hypothetical protein NGRA_3365 [Nosema granulosis]